MLNKICLMGRMVRDPELRHTSDDTPVTSFTIACERDFRGRNGDKETDFIDITAWRTTAAFVAKYITKGRIVVVEGRLQIRAWEDNDGNKHRAPEIVASNVYFADSKRDGEAKKEDPLDNLANTLDAYDDLPFSLN